MRKARVFISCGQYSDEEKKYGLKLANYFRTRGFDPYFAEEIQTPEMLTNSIFESLKKSEYFISINFSRNESNVGSLFVQQEFAIAVFLGIEMISFQKGDIKFDGMGKYLLLKSIEFNSYEDLLSHVEILTKNWNPDSIHQLELNVGNFAANFVTANQPNAPLSNWIHIIVHNKSKTFYCKHCYAFVESIFDLRNNRFIFSLDDYKTELIWAGTNEVTINIPQDGKRDIDAVFWYQGTSTIGFHQRSTSTQYCYPDLPYGKYKIIYGIISDNFPTAKIEVCIEFNMTGIAVLRSDQIKS